MSKRLLRTAYHEAGHAVIAVTLGIRFKHVTIAPDDAQDSLGRVLTIRPRWFSPDAATDARSEKWVFNHILMSYAGQEAERLLTRRANNVGARFDNEGVRELACCLSGDEEEWRALLKWLRLRARRLVAQPFNTVAIRAVAEALVEQTTLTEAQVKEVRLAAIQAAVVASGNSRRVSLD